MGCGCSGVPARPWLAAAAGCPAQVWTHHSRGARNSGETHPLGAGGGAQRVPGIQGRHISRPSRLMLQLLLTVEWMAGSNFCLGAVVLLAELFCCFVVQGDAHSLCYILNVSATGPSWCEFLGTINGTPFFKYSCKSGMATPVGPMGMMLNATEACSQWCDLWTELLPELREVLLDNGDNICKAFDSLSLQVHVMCQQESNGCYSTFCRFDINEQMCLRFDSKSRRWTELHPGCRSLKETLESDRYVTSLLVKISHGDYVKLLNQSIVLDTKAAPIMATTMASVPAPSKAVIIKDNIALVLTPIFILITLGI